MRLIVVVGLALVVAAALVEGKKTAEEKAAAKAERQAEKAAAKAAKQDCKEDRKAACGELNAEISARKEGEKSERREIRAERKEALDKLRQVRREAKDVARMTFKEVKELLKGELVTDLGEFLNDVEENFNSTRDAVLAEADQLIAILRQNSTMDTSFLADELAAARDAYEAALAEAERIFNLAKDARDQNSTNCLDRFDEMLPGFEVCSTCDLIIDIINCWPCVNGFRQDRCRIQFFPYKRICEPCSCPSQTETVEDCEKCGSVFYPAEPNPQYVACAAGVASAFEIAELAFESATATAQEIFDAKEEEILALLDEVVATLAAQEAEVLAEADETIAAAFAEKSAIFANQAAEFLAAKELSRQEYNAAKDAAKQAKKGAMSIADQIFLAAKHSVKAAYKEKLDDSIAESNENKEQDKIRRNEVCKAKC